METKFSAIETSKERHDLNFRLEDGSILHLEEEVDLSQDDLIRFASYDLKMYNRYRDRVRTIIMCVNYPTQIIDKICTIGTSYASDGACE